MFKTQFPRGRNSFEALNNLPYDLTDGNLEDRLVATHAKADKEIDLVLESLANPSQMPKVGKSPLLSKTLAVGKKSIVVEKNQHQQKESIWWNQLEWTR